MLRVIDSLSPCPCHVEARPALQALMAKCKKTSSGSLSAPSAGSSVATVEDIVDKLAQEVDMAEEAATQRFLSALSTGSTPVAVAKTVLTDKDTLHTAEKFLNENIARNPNKHPVYGQLCSSFRNTMCTCQAPTDGWDVHDSDCDFHDSTFTIADIVAGLAMLIEQVDLIPWVLPLLGSSCLLAAADGQQDRQM